MARTRRLDPRGHLNQLAAAAACRYGPAGAAPPAVDEPLHVAPAGVRLVLAHGLATAHQMLGVRIGAILAALTDRAGLLPVPQLALVDLRFQASCACDVHLVSFIPARSRW
jgi:hypothetical protein